MPNYKKKKVGKFLSPEPKPRTKKAKNKKEYEDIKMSSSAKKGYRKNENLKVVEGRRQSRKKKIKAISSFIVVILIVGLFLQILFPAGVGEWIKIKTAVMGTGRFPITLKSTETVNTVAKDSYYYVLGNTHISAFSNSGKELFSFEHGFENPVLKTSASRSLVYDQGGTNLYILNIKGESFPLVTERPILTAAVSDKGNFAVATTSKKYTSEVLVYDKEGKTIYEWYSAKDIVNAVALSSNGKKLAVGTLNIENSKFISKLSVLDFKSATPKYTETFEDTKIRRIDSSFSATFAVVTDKKIKTYRWANFKSKVAENNYDVMFFDSFKNGYIAVFARENDKTDNRVVVLNKRGKIKFQFTISGTISDIAVQGHHIYCMSETEISIIDDEGKTVKKTSCGFGGKNICVLSSDSVAVITDNQIQKIKFTKG